MRFTDKVALITGGSSGIGRATAVAFAEEGARVAIDARRAERLAEAVEEIEDLGGEVLALAGDVSQPEHVASLVEQTMERWGRLDYVVPNAGVNGTWAPIEEMTPEEWDTTHHINVRGTFLTVKYAIPHLREAGGGSIVIISSVNGTRIFSNWGFSCYGSSKAAQVAFARLAAVELAQWNIRVNCVCPGGTRTNIMEGTRMRNLDKIRIPRHYPQGMIPLGQRPAEPEEVAAAILYLCSHEARYVTGTELYVDGALSLFQG